MTVALVGAAMALAALVVSMAGTATGLPGKNRIDRNDLRKRVVKPIHVRKNAIRGFQLAPNAAGGFHVKEGTLGEVPRAADAGRVDGNSVRRLFERVSNNATTPVAALGGLDLSLDCDLTSDAGVRLEFGATPTAYRLVRITEGGNVLVSAEANRTGGSPLITGTNNLMLLTAASGGRTLSAQIQTWDAGEGALGQAPCLYTGFLTIEG